MVNRSGSLDAEPVGGVVGVEASALVASNLPPAPVDPREAKRLLEERAAAVGIAGVGANGVEALEGDLFRDLRVEGDERPVSRLGRT
jgi:hypothetical protein